ncbi:hypothetical protein [uncultured Mycolicibacterium sp.]|uniref:hypothetical protein n=1 Tax=uncultured Mycolicibacterium sp. TaxID=2320817 RepID=UPI0026321EF4|nr:hypothetical protein [uncultured Mycolicibacterium sp.]
MTTQETVGAPAAPTRPDNRLALIDQAFYDGHRAAGQNEVMQVVWLYDHPADLDGVRRFHQRMCRSLWNRLIERSPLPFGRHRWVLDPRPAPFDVVETPRPRAELGDWLDERAYLPVDPERGPGWHLGVLPLTDGSTVVTCVISHYLLDGLGSVAEVAKANLGMPLDYGYPPPGSRPRLRAIAEDLSDTARALPGVAGAVLAAAREARRRQTDNTRPAPGPIHDDHDPPVRIPCVWLLLDLAEWEARAAALGGAGNTLATGFAARLADRLGRRDDDGTIRIQFIVSNRDVDDTRAIAVSYTRTNIDPAPVTTDLSGTRAVVREALRSPQGAMEESAPLLPLTPLTPRRTWRRLMDWSAADPERPTILSNFGEVPSSAVSPDGTESQQAWARGVNQRISAQRLERAGGLLQILTGRLPGIGKMPVSVQAYQPGVATDRAALRGLVVDTLAEFGLTAVVD